jgi:hypothetical protein
MSDDAIGSAAMTSTVVGLAEVRRVVVTIEAPHPEIGCRPTVEHARPFGIEVFSA